MTTTIATEENKYVTLSDRVDIYHAPAIRTQFTQLLAEQNVTFILDLTKATFIDSAGLAALVQFWTHARQQGGDVKFILPEDENVTRIFHLTQFDQVFEILPRAEK
ncbi:MAG TPA: STAS domain-containing protein [Anaerolineales bacterium]|nr:STAS domain-containing protein [Anaerolineales bacterium]